MSSSRGKKDFEVSKTPKHGLPREEKIQRDLNETTKLLAESECRAEAVVDELRQNHRLLDDALSEERAALTQRDAALTQRDAALTQRDAALARGELLEEALRLEQKAHRASAEDAHSRYRLIQEEMGCIRSIVREKELRCDALKELIEDLKLKVSRRDSQISKLQQDQTNHKAQMAQTQKQMRNIQLQCNLSSKEPPSTELLHLGGLRSSFRSNPSLNTSSNNNTSPDRGGVTTPGRAEAATLRLVIDRRDQELEVLRTRLSEAGSGVVALETCRAELGAAREEVARLQHTQLENIELSCAVSEMKERVNLWHQDMEQALEQLSSAEEGKDGGKADETTEGNRNNNCNDSLFPGQHKSAKGRSYETMEGHVRLSIQLAELKSKLSRLGPRLGTRVHGEGGAVVKETAHLKRTIETLNKKVEEGQTACNLLKESYESERKDTETLRKRLVTKSADLQEARLAVQRQREEIEKTRLEITHKDQRLEQLEDDLSRKNLQVERSQNEMRLLHQAEKMKERDRLESLDRAHKEQCHLYVAKVKGLEAKVKQLAVKLRAAESECRNEQEARSSALRKTAALSAEVEELEAKLAAVDREREDENRLWDEERDRLTMAVSDLTSRLKEVEDELSHSIRLREKAEADFASVKSRLESALESSRSEREVLKSSNDTLVGEIQAMSQRLCESERALDNTQLMMEEGRQRINQLEGSQSKLQEHISQLERAVIAERVDKENLVIRFKEERQEAGRQDESRIAEIESLIRQRETLNNHKINLVQEIDHLKHTLHKSQRSEREINDKAAALGEEINNLKADLIAKKDLERKLQDLNSECKNEAENNRQLRMELKESREEADRLTEVTSDLQERVEQAREERDLEIHRSLDAERDAKEANSAISELQGQLHEQERQLQSRIQQMANLDYHVRDQQASANQQIDHLSQALRKAQQEMAGQGETIQELTHRLGQYRHELEVCRKEVRTQEDVASAARQELDNKAKQMQATQDAIGSLEDKTVSLQQRVNFSCAELGSKSERITWLEQALQSVQRQLARSEEGQAALERHLEASRRQGEELAAKIEEEKENVRAEALREVDRARAGLEALQSQHQEEIIRLEQAQRDMVNRREEVAEELKVREHEWQEERLRLKRAQTLEAQRLERLKEQLESRQGLLHAANETVVTKEAEIARLSAKVSTYERAHITAANRRHEPSQVGTIPNGYSINQENQFLTHSGTALSADPSGRNSIGGSLQNHSLIARLNLSPARQPLAPFSLNENLLEESAEIIQQLEEANRETASKLI